MYKLYSQRKKEEEEGVSDVYIYGKFCPEFRNQFLHIVEDVFGSVAHEKYVNLSDGSRLSLWELTCKEYAREKGLKHLTDNGGYYRNVNNFYAFEYYVDKSDDVDFLDLLDFTFAVIISNKATINRVGQRIVDDAIEELNYRFKQHSLGYEFINGKVIPKTNEFIHTEIIKPALHLLHNKIFAGAEQEYLQAFEFYKKKQNKDAILYAAKAFESVLKSICQEMHYPYDKDKDRIIRLLQHLSDNNFYPKSLENHLNGIRVTLESGAVTLRNQKSAHGQGQEIVDVPDEYAEYTLGLVATNVVLFADLFDKAKK